jgi:hypothetical protein
MKLRKLCIATANGIDRKGGRRNLELKIKKLKMKVR